MFESFQPSLFAAATAERWTAADLDFSSVRRVELGDGSWIDHAIGWLPGADEVFDDLRRELPWRQREVTMYDRRLAEPRLTWWWDAAEGTPEPLPALAEVRTALIGHYRLAFDAIGCNWYRDGQDSVAWHRDRERRLAQPVVAIVSTGSRRTFLLRPFGGGKSLAFPVEHGDLLVMGGRCQHDWEHCVPKTAHAGPRISITVRHHSDDPV